MEVGTRPRFMGCWGEPYPHTEQEKAAQEKAIVEIRMGKKADSR
jgi:hypothetical protein